MQKERVSILIAMKNRHNSKECVRWFKRSESFKAAMQRSTSISLGKSLAPVMRRLKSCYRNPMLQARITCSVKIRGIVLRQNVFRPKWNQWSLPYFIRRRVLHPVEVFRVTCPSMTCHVHIVKDLQKKHKCSVSQSVSESVSQWVSQLDSQSVSQSNLANLCHAKDFSVHVWVSAWREGRGAFHDDRSVFPW